jgi:hypothetical protein
MGAYFTRSDCEGFYEVLYIQCSGWEWCWYIVEWRMGMWVSVSEDKGTDCENGEWCWLVKVQGIWCALFIKCMKITVKDFFLADVLFLGGCLWFG